MTQEKQKRLIIASTVGAVLLVLILLMIMVYQLIAIGVENRRYNELTETIAEYEQLIADGEDSIKIQSTYNWIVRRARELGYRFENDELLK